MVDALSSVVPFAAGVAASPFPIVAVILVLFSRRARVNGPVFLVGWMAGLSVVVTVAYLVVDRLDRTSGDTAGMSWARLALGVALLIAAWRTWSSDSGPDGESEPPRWMAAAQETTPARVLGLAALLAANPKNLVLAAAAGAALAEMDPTPRATAAALGTFVLIGSAPSLAAVSYRTFGGDRSTARLESARSWLTLHHAAVLATLYLILGALLISAGLGRR